MNDATLRTSEHESVGRVSPVETFSIRAEDGMAEKCWYPGNGQLGRRAHGSTKLDGDQPAANLLVIE